MHASLAHVHFSCTSVSDTRSFQFKKQNLTVNKMANTPWWISTFPCMHVTNNQVQNLMPVFRCVRRGGYGAIAMLKQTLPYPLTLFCLQSKIGKCHHNVIIVPVTTSVLVTSSCWICCLPITPQGPQPRRNPLLKLPVQHFFPLILARL